MQRSPPARARAGRGPQGDYALNLGRGVAAGRGSGLEAAKVKGYTTRILEYDRVEGVILRPAEAVVRYGTLLLVSDRSQGKEFLGMVVNVKEETTHPALDVERFKELYMKISEVRLEDANRVLEELFSPSQELIRWNSVMTIDVRILGEVSPGGLSGYDRPPRPLSSINDVDPSMLERIIHAGIEGYRERGVYIGRLSINPEVRVYLNPERFTMHVSILAQTGGGKTETVKRLVAETLWRKDVMGKPKGGAIVFDVAGEYTGYPYVKPETVPLLDAVAKPEEFGGPLDGWHRRARFTVLVPYDSPGWKGVDRLAQELVDLAAVLKDRTGLGWRAVLVGRDSIVDLGYPGAAGRSHLGRGGFARLVSEEKALVVGVPYPSFASIDEVVERAGSTSEYFEPVIYELAGQMDVMEGDEILSVPLVYFAVKLAFQHSRTPPSRQFIAKIGELASQVLGGSLDRSSFRAVKEELASKGGQHWRFISYEDVASLANAALFLADARGLGVDEALGVLVEGLRDAVDAVSSFYEQRTLASVLRGLKKVVLRSSSALDPYLFDMLVARVSEGFTIVHLAPPSMGDVDQLLGLIVRRVFYYHVGRYDPERLTLLVVEEAHNLAPPGDEKASKKSLLRVAREGRKWGISLWLVTQRPSFVDAGLLSQTATSILLRTTNPEDLATIRRSVESAASEIVDRLPELEPSRGEALVVGLAAPERRIPLLVSVEMLSAGSPS